MHVCSSYLSVACKNGRLQKPELVDSIDFIEWISAIHNPAHEVALYHCVNCPSNLQKKKKYGRKLVILAGDK